MEFVRHRLWLVALAVAMAACTTTPTSPSTSSGPRALTVGAASPDPTSIPSAIVPAPPQALGATRFLGFGDSITYGTLSSFDGIFLSDVPGSYPSLLQGMLRQYNTLPGVPAERFAALNEGLPGETARQGIDRLPDVLSQHRPQVLLLLEGINDMNFGASVEQTAANVHYMVQIGRLFNCAVLVATMPQTYPSDYPDGTRRNQSADKIVPFNTEVRRLVSGMQNVHVVDIYAAFGDDRSLMGADGLHPSSTGYQVMAQQFHAAITTIFPVRGSLQ